MDFPITNAMVSSPVNPILTFLNTFFKITFFIISHTIYMFHILIYRNSILIRMVWEVSLPLSNCVHMYTITFSLMNHRMGMCGKVALPVLAS